jgi:hypothetical protein
MHVIFRNYSSKVPGLYFLHNGRKFTAIDCLGLSSVGLSTKGSDSEGGANKRTIGFMGIGFKAVYKRFAKVSIYDDKHAFAFEEPARPAPTEPGHAWVMKPHWIDNRAGLWDASPSSATSEWCHFQLERPRGGPASVQEDLRTLPQSIPALLGRQAIENHRQATNGQISDWILEWNETRNRVSRQPDNASNTAWAGSAMSRTLTASHWSAVDECIQVQISSTSSRSSSSSLQSDGATKIWQFVTLKYIPSADAQAAYAQHTKKQYGNGDPTAREESSFFFETTPDGCPVVPTNRGAVMQGSVHAVLPTKLRLPFACQWNGSWLLSVDRQVS